MFGIGIVFIGLSILFCGLLGYGLVDEFADYTPSKRPPEEVSDEYKDSQDQVVEDLKEVLGDRM